MSDPTPGEMSSGDGAGRSEPRGWRHAPTWMKLLLIVSLSANVLVAGVIGGKAFRDWRERAAVAKVAPGLDRRQARILRMVPAARRDEVGAILAARRAEIEAARRELREASLAFIEALRAEPLDPERVAAALARRQEASRRYWTISTEQVAEIARVLGPDERRELARRLEERMKRVMARIEGRRTK